MSKRTPDMRYRLRRDGFREELTAECFGLYCAALSHCGRPPPAAEVLGAARSLVGGFVVDHADAGGRLDALALAAAAFALRGTPVHLLTVSEPRARRMAEMLEAPFRVLGFGVGCVRAGMARDALSDAYARPVVCGAQREIASAYLQDRLNVAGKPRLALQAIEGRAAKGGRPARLLRGLHCALVEEADVAMLDDAYAPITITAEADLGQQRLLYEQALELARACRRDRDFDLDSDGVRLTAEGAERIGRLVAPLGGIWAGPHRREELVCAALDALHARQAGVDYRVEHGRVVFPRPALGDEPEAQLDTGVRMLIELKEGCRITTARDVLARISVPRFYRRYLHLAGVCADACGVESEFWDLYGLKAMGAGAPPEPVASRARVFVDVAAKQAALVESVRSHVADASVLIAVRASAEAQVVLQVLAEAGIGAGLLRGAFDEAERTALASLDRPGGVAVTLFPGDRLFARTALASASPHLIVAVLLDASRHVALIQRTFGVRSAERLLSLDEEVMSSGVRALASAILRFRGTPAGELPAEVAGWLAWLAQGEAARARDLMRRDVVLRDQYLSDLLAFSGRRD